MDGLERPTFEDGIWKGIVKPPMEDWRHFRSILLERLNKYPYRIAQINAATGQIDTYGDMADRVTRCSVWLRKQNLLPGDIVSICTYNHSNTSIPLVASVLVGAIPNPWWDATLNEDMIRYFLNLTKPKMIFSDETRIEKIKKVVDETGENIRVICLNDITGFESLNHIIEIQNSHEVAKFKCEDLEDLREPAMILYTSGTTGYPKGAVLPYAWLQPFMPSISETPKINFWPASISWASGIMNTFSNIASCSTAVIHPSPNEEIILEIIEKYKVTTVQGLNTAYAIRLWKTEHLKNYDLSSLKHVMIGGSAMLPEVDEFVEKFFNNAIVINGYGCTELGALCYRLGWTGKPTSCGHVTANVQLKIIDIDTGKILGPNQEGELCAKSPYGMLRYRNNPEATTAALDTEGWYHTGDIAYYDDDGEFFIVDRLKELIKFRMVFHIAPGLIENVILSNPEVFEAAVVAKPHVEDIEQPMAFISLYPNAKVTPMDIIDLVAANLPDHMKLRGGVVILDKLPYTNSGKISKKELRQLIKSSALNDE